MKKQILLFGLLVPLSALLSSCYGHTMIVLGDNPGPVVYHYWYYPDMGVYYDYDAHVYFYMEGGSWHRGAYLPPRYHELGGYVVVESEKGRPWARYDAHRAKYPPGQWRKDDDDRGEGHHRHHFDDD
ncbi:MAG TPA: hypothetical protein VJ873_02530 [bacterium]|nr:hypothetical protein [bacterium]